MTPPKNAKSLTDPRLRQFRRSSAVGLVTLIFVSLAMAGLLGRVVQLQLTDAPKLDRFAGSRQSTMPLPARRGDLEDRHGHPFAVSHIGYRLFVDPRMIEDQSRFAVDLAHVLRDDPARIDRLIGDNADRRYVVIDKLLGDDQLEEVTKLRSKAIGLEPRVIREYPQGKLAGPLIGFVGEDGTGLDGLELLLNKKVTGQPGHVTYLHDAQRRPVWVEQADYIPPQPGPDVRLSIDLVVQGIAEQVVDETCTHYRAKSAEAIVMQATTGQLLAVVNWPGFDPSQRGNVRPDFRKDRAVTDPFEPGSIFKPFVHAPATEAGIARPDEKIDTTTSGSFAPFRGRILHDAHPSGTITWDQVLVKSSNIGMSQIGMRMGEKRMYEAVHKFGFGEMTGSGLPGESRGIVNPLKRWSKYSITSVPMGQEIAVTPLQMVRGFSAFANGGLVVTPSILASQTDQPLYQRAIGPAVADHTREVLRRVITEGTGKKAASKLYRIWGKTGTAQVPDRVHGGYIERAYTASFICGAPLRNPAIIVIVVIHQPDPAVGHFGGIVAAPAAAQIVDQTLGYLGVPPDAEEDGPPDPSAGRRPDNPSHFAD